MTASFLEQGEVIAALSNAAAVLVPRRGWLAATDGERGVLPAAQATAADLG